MPCYPLFFDLKNRPVLIIGAGNAAYQKASRLVRYTDHLRILAPSFLPAFQRLEGVEKICRTWNEDDLDGVFLVVAATGHFEEDERIAAACEKRNILCNAVDEPSIGSVIFGAVVSKEELSIGISTNGASPSAARYLKKEISQSIPDWFDDVLLDLHARRETILKTVSDEKTRTKIFHALFDASLKKQGALDQSEADRIVKEYV